MAKNADFVSHKKSRLKNQDGSPQLPLASALVEGEIAINFAENVETLSIKNESGHVVTFSSDNYYTEKKLGSGFTGANSGVTVTDAILWISGTGENAIVQKGGNNTASGELSVAMGSGTTASGDYSVAKGNRTTASGWGSHAEGYSTLASGYTSHAEGDSTKASDSSSHAEGSYTTASGSSSHAEGGYTKASGGQSHAEGNNTKANGYASHSEGDSTIANGYASHAEGYYTSATSYVSHAEGYYTFTLNESEHASGRYNVSNSASTTFGDSGNTLFSVGNGTADNARHNAFEIRQNGDIYIVSGDTNIKLQDNIGGGGGSITVDQVLDDTTSASTNPVSSKAVYKAVTDNELVWTNAYVTLSGVVSSHTENTEIHLTSTEKSNIDSLATNIAAISGITSTKVGNWDAAATSSHTHSNKSALDSITGNVGTMAYQNTSSYSSATQVNTALTDKADTATTYTKTEVDERDLWVSGTGTSSVAQKDGNNTASGKLSVAMGSGTTASGDYSVAEGRNTKASGSSSHAEGNSTTASSSSSHAEGFNTIASGSSSHAEGYRTVASGTSSHAEGMSTTARGSYSHAEGYYTTASSESSHAEGYTTTASGGFSHAEGFNTTASGQSSHAEGDNTKANNQSEHASGQYNVSNSASTDFGDSGNTLFSVGNGSANDARHNAFEIRQNGDIYLNDGSMLQTTLSGKSNTGHTHTISDVTNLDIKVGVVSAVTVSSDLSNVTCPDSITGASNTGAQAMVIYENGGTTTDYTITVSTSYKSPDGSQISITCPKNGYCEVNYVNINGTIYARGA